MSVGQVELDSIWRELGTWGRFQIFQAVVLSLNIVAACFTILTAVFTGYVPDYTCSELPANQVNTTDDIVYKYGKCEIKTYRQVGNITELLGTDFCRYGYNYSVPSETTYTAEWDLVCSRSNLPPLAQSLVLAGQGVGAMFLSHLADRFGRKTIMVLSSIGILVSCSAIALSPSIIMVLVLRVVSGTFQQGIVCTEAPLRLEIFPREKRAAISALTGVFWPCGIMVLSLFGYLFQELSWRYLQLALAAWSVISLGEWWMIEESMRWLLANDRIKEAKAILKKAAMWNRVDYNKIETILNEVIKDKKSPADRVAGGNGGHVATIEAETAKVNGTEDKEISPARGTDKNNISNENTVRYSIKDILTDSKLRINTFILWYTWLTVAFTYYGLTLVSVKFAGNRFLNFFLSGLFEIPSSFLMWYFCDRIGRRKTIIVSYAVTGCCLIVATGLLSTLEHIQAVSITATGLSLIGKMAISGAFGTVFLYTPEIYPTNYRNRGLGIASSLSRIGAVLAPFASNLADIALWIPAAIFGGMCLLVAVLALKLPESKHYQLPQSLQEIQKWTEQGPTQTNSTTNVS